MQFFKNTIPAVSALLMLLTGGAFAAPGDVSETTFFSGTNRNAIFFKKCSLQISRYNGSLVVVSAADNKNVYNIWMNGQELSKLPGGSILYANGAIALDHKNRDSGITVYSTHKVDAAAKRTSFALELEVEPETQKILRFDLRHFDQSVLNHIDCLAVD